MKLFKIFSLFFFHKMTCGDERARQNSCQMKMDGK